MRIFLLLFILLPLVEIYLLITIGGAIGAFSTILLILATAILGVWLVRAQGFSVFARYRQQLASGRSPAMQVFEGMLLFVAGALLLTPGFFTDAIGFILLVPKLRRALINAAIGRRVVDVFVARGGGRVIESERDDDSQR